MPQSRRKPRASLRPHVSAGCVSDPGKYARRSCKNRTHRHEDTGHTDTRIQDTQTRGYRTHRHEDTAHTDTRIQDTKTVNKPYIIDLIVYKG